jgi:hypothetical protein
MYNTRSDLSHQTMGTDIFHPHYVCLKARPGVQLTTASLNAVADVLDGATAGDLVGDPTGGVTVMTPPRGETANAPSPGASRVTRT